MFGLNTQRTINVSNEKFNIERKDTEKTLYSLYENSKITWKFFNVSKKWLINFELYDGVSKDEAIEMFSILNY